MENGIIFFGIIVFFLVSVLGFAQSYVKRFFTWLKMREDNYLDAKSLDIIQSYVRLMLFGIIFFTAMAISTMLPVGYQEPFQYAASYIFIFLGFVAFSVFMILSMLGSSAVANYRKIAEHDGKSVLKPGIMEFWELFIKYGMLLMGFIIAVFIAIVTIPNEVTRDRVFSTLHLDTINASNMASEALSLFIILLVLFIIGKFVEIIIEDFKGRSTKFQPGILDMIKATVKYALYWVGFMIVLLVVLEMVEPIIAYIVIGFIMSITAIIILVIGLSPAFRNAISGLILLTTDSINKGDWVQIGGDNTGEIIAQGLVITSIKTRNGDLIDLPNEMIISKSIHNYTKLGGTLARIALKIKSEMEQKQVEILLLRAAEGLDESDAVISDRADLNITITDMGPEFLEYTIDIWRKEPATIEATASRYLRRVHVLSRENKFQVLSTRIVD
jgi:small-conductance mechanosensitive channel